MRCARFSFGFFIPTPNTTPSLNTLTHDRRLSGYSFAGLSAPLYALGSDCVSQSARWYGEWPWEWRYERQYKNTRLGESKACLCLLKVAVGYKWFELVYAHPHCFLSARPKFHEPSGGVLNESPHGYVMVYLGREKAAFQMEFSRLGQVYMPA